MDIKNQKNLVQSYYESHHINGRRLYKSFLEAERGELFSNWIGVNKKILDLGGRDGTLTKYFVENNDVTIGDIDENALSNAKKNYKIKTKKVDQNKSLPYLDDSFDIVVMAEVLEHLPYPSVSLSEIKRVLNTNGEFF